VMLAAATGGKLGDRFGKIRVMKIALPIYGVGLLLPFVTQSPVVLAPTIPMLAFGGGLVMTLPYAILMPLMPDAAHGALTGFYSLSRGLGTMLGPLLGGVAVALYGGYPGTWAVSGGAILLSVLFLLRLQRSAADRERLRAL
jgi:MFS family permease